MKRYLLFIGESYYPRGGWFDFKESFDTLAQCHHYLLHDNIHGDEWWHIVDTKTMTIIERK